MVGGGEVHIVIEDTPYVSPATRLSHSSSRDPLFQLTNAGCASTVVLVNSNLIARYRRRSHDETVDNSGKVACLGL